MNHRDFLTTIVRPSLDALRSFKFARAPGQPAEPLPLINDPAAPILLTATADYQSLLTYTIAPNGAALGYWMFDKKLHTLAVITSARTAHPSRALCDFLGVRAGLDDVHDALALRHVFACAMALLLLSRPGSPLPDDAEMAYRWVCNAWEMKLDRARWNDSFHATIAAANDVSLVG